jgi:hypothetical protein
MLSLFRSSDFQSFDFRWLDFAMTKFPDFPNPVSFGLFRSVLSAFIRGEVLAFSDHRISRFVLPAQNSRCPRCSSPPVGRKPALWPLFVPVCHPLSPNCANSRAASVKGHCSFSSSSCSRCLRSSRILNIRRMSGPVFTVSPQPLFFFSKPFPVLFRFRHIRSSNFSLLPGLFSVFYSLPLGLSSVFPASPHHRSSAQISGKPLLPITAIGARGAPLPRLFPPFVANKDTSSIRCSHGPSGEQ